MAKRRSFTFERTGVRKKTRQGAGRRSKGLKRYRGQGGPRKRSKLPKK
jgi:hypothetical protein